MLALRIIATVILGIGLLSNGMRIEEQIQIEGNPADIIGSILDFIASIFIIVVVWVL